MLEIKKIGEASSFYRLALSPEAVFGHLIVTVEEYPSGYYFTITSEVGEEKAFWESASKSMYTDSGFQYPSSEEFVNDVYYKDGPIPLREEGGKVILRKSIKE
jgi:hypothetical protein